MSSAAKSGPRFTRYIYIHRIQRGEGAQWKSRAKDNVGARSLKKSLVNVSDLPLPFLPSRGRTDICQWAKKRSRSFFTWKKPTKQAAPWSEWTRIAREAFPSLTLSLSLSHPGACARTVFGRTMDLGEVRNVATRLRKKKRITGKIERKASNGGEGKRQCRRGFPCSLLSRPSCGNSSKQASERTRVTFLRRRTRREKNADVSMRG